MAAFVDTNVLIYALVADEKEAADKVNIARELVAGLTRRGELVVSAQVLSEFSANAMRKGNPPLTVSETLTHIRQLSNQRVLPIDESLVQLALQRVQQTRISYWDALIVEAALRSGATVLYTEDMHHGTGIRRTRTPQPLSCRTTRAEFQLKQRRLMASLTLTTEPELLLGRLTGTQGRSELGPQRG